MHELGYCGALLAAVDRRAQGRAVTRVGVRAGVRHQLVDEVMQMAWKMVADGTAYADAQTEITFTPMDATCPGCGAQFSTDDQLAQCPRCDLVGPRLRGGDEFGLAWLEYADSSGRDTAEEALGSPDLSNHHHDHADEGG